VKRLAAVLLLAAGCSAADVPTPSRDPRFDWFEYAGRDPVFAQTAAAGEYHNPILAGFYLDPSIVGVNGDYYLVTSSFVYFPGLPIFHSRNLVEWTQVGFALDRPSQLPVDTLGVSRGIFAPAIRYHDGTYYLICTLVDAGGNFLITATNPAGPWSDPIPLDFDGIDPDIFFDDDGKSWILNNGPPDEAPRYDGHRAIWMQEYDRVARKMVGPRRVIVNGGVNLAERPIWIEAPHIYKVDGWYYLLCAEGGTAEQHSAVILRSRTVTGPYTPYAGNPILTQRHLDPARPNPVTSTGHADFVQTPAGDWWAVFLGTRPYEGDFYNTGRETFLLPVSWENGWPTILHRDSTVPYSHPRPELAATRAPLIPTAGNFTYRDEFADTTLRRDWQTLRTPREEFYDLRTNPGSLQLTARPVSINERRHASFIARRQQHQAFEASTVMHYAPEVDGDKAGLVAFQNERFYFLLGVTRVNGQREVRLERFAGDSTQSEAAVVASAPWPASEGSTISLRVTATGRDYSFAYASRPGEWIVLGGPQDGTILSTKVARGFVGTMLGMYAYRATP